MRLNTKYHQFEIKWIKYPFIRILSAFIPGILIGSKVDIDLLATFTLLGLCLLLLLKFHLKSKEKFIYQQWFGVCVYLVFFLLGWIWVWMLNEKNQLSHFYNNNTSNYHYLVTKSYYVEEKDRYWDCYSNVLQRLDQNEFRNTHGKLLIRISKKSRFIPQKGDILQGGYKLIKPTGRSAPFEFDWANLLAHRNIHWITYADTATIEVLKKGTLTKTDKIRQWSDDLIKNTFEDERDYPVASAMLLGLRKKIDPELYKAYSATGAVHVLAVSGLHVGILATIFEWIFGFLFKMFKAPKWIPSLLLLIIIWLYTFLTGATPSILRSAIMFSLFVIGKLIQKDPQPLNILGSAAFILLLINPLDIYNIGFQLSFMAMAGIFILYEPIRVLLNPTSKLGQLIWQICAVSLAAQFFIFPIVGYHFHQFAFYFWLTSLISTPFSFVILAAGVINFIVIPLGIPILTFVKYPLIYSVKWMNDLIGWIYTLPLGQLKGWWPSITDVLFLLVLGVLLSVWLRNRSYIALRVFLIAAILFVSSLFVQNLYSNSVKEIVAYSNRGQSYCWVKNRNQIIQIKGDSALIHSNYVQSYHISPSAYISLGSKIKEYQSSHLTIDSMNINSRAESYFIFDKNISYEELYKACMKNQTIIILSDYWKTLKEPITTTVCIHINNKLEVEKLRADFPNAQIIPSKNSFIQLDIP